MIAVALLLSAALRSDTTAIDSLRPPALPSLAQMLAADQDTIRRRPRAIEVSEWYHRRLLLHKTLFYASIPVFGVQWYAGNKMYDQSNGPAPSWAKPLHKAGAATIAGIFTVNTATGLWNLWDSRNAPDHKWLRLTHSLTMLGADAAFAYTGIQLAHDADRSLDRRRQHRNVALVSMGVTVASGLSMSFFNNR
ncbi:MAG TPA: hypothetical protein VHL32_08560 [Gemmatimonadaceae bacterium]|nr:hypothetical protein [Gemmatimonadaceae bacterium]